MEKQAVSDKLLLLSTTAAFSVDHLIDMFHYDWSVVVLPLTADLFLVCKCKVPNITNTTGECQKFVNDHKFMLTCRQVLL